MLSRLGRGVGRQWVVVAALVAALAGTAVAGSGKDVTRGKAKKIASDQATKQIEWLAPSLAVARADTASEATVAGRAVVAREAATAARADPAVTAVNAGRSAGLRRRTSALRSCSARWRRCRTWLAGPRGPGPVRRDRGIRHLRISGPIAVPEGAKLGFNTDGTGNSEDEAITYPYRLLRD